MATSVECMLGGECLLHPHHLGHLSPPVNGGDPCLLFSSRPISFGEIVIIVRYLLLNNNEWIVTKQYIDTK